MEWLFLKDRITFQWKFIITYLLSENYSPLKHLVIFPKNLIVFFQKIHSKSYKFEFTSSLHIIKQT